MNWQKLHDELYYVDGSWRDIYVLGTDESDWEKWVDYVNEAYPIEFYNGSKQTTENRIDFETISTYWSGKASYPNHAVIHIKQIKINCHFFSISIIENDFNPKSIEYISDHESVINYMACISVILKKDVLLCPENLPDDYFVSVKNGITTLSLND